MYLVPIAWIYVTLMMAVAEAGSSNGTVLGAIIMVLLANGMNMANISPFVQTAIKGGLLLAIVGLQSRKKMGL